MLRTLRNEGTFMAAFREKLGHPWGKFWVIFETCISQPCVPFSMYVTGMFQYIPPSHLSYSLPQLALLSDI